MEGAEDLANENVLLKKELERKEVEETLRRKKEKKMEEQEMGNPDTSLVGDAEPVNPTKRKPEIEEGLREKQEEAQKEPNPVQRVDDAAGTVSQEETGENSDNGRKTSYLDDKTADSIPARRSPCNDESKERDN